MIRESTTAYPLTPQQLIYAVERVQITTYDNCYSHNYRYGGNSTVLKNDFSKLAETREVNMIIYSQYLMIILIINNIYQNDQHHKKNPRI